MVIILYLVNFIAVCEEAEDSCWLSNPSLLPQLSWAVTEVILTTSRLGGGAHLLIEKQSTKRGLHDRESPRPISGVCTGADVTRNVRRRRSEDDVLNDEVSERMRRLPRLEPDRKDSGTEQQKPNLSL